MAAVVPVPVLVPEGAGGFPVELPPALGHPQPHGREVGGGLGASNGATLRCCARVSRTCRVLRVLRCRHHPARPRTRRNSPSAAPAASPGEKGPH